MRIEQLLDMEEEGEEAMMATNIPSRDGGKNELGLKMEKMEKLMWKLNLFIVCFATLVFGIVVRYDVMH